MKNLKLVLVASFFCVLASATNCQTAADRFIDQVKKEKHSITMTLPGWLVQAGVSMAVEDDLEESEGLADIVHGLKKVRFSVIDEQHNIEKKDIDKLIRLSIEEDKMQLYAKVKDDGQQLQVLVKENNDRIRTIVIVSYSANELVILNAKTNISLTDLENARFSFNEMTDESN